MVLSLLFLASWLGAIACLTNLAARTIKTKTLILSIPLAIIVNTCMQALVAKILTMLHIPVNLIGISIANIIIMLICIFALKRTGLKKAKLWDRLDVIALAIALLACLVVGYLQFGLSLEIHWKSSDPSVHLFETVKIVDTGEVRGQFLHWLFMAQWMMFASSFMESFYFYKVQIISEIFCLFLDAWAFYAIVKSSKSKFAICASVVLPTFYMMGYPLNCIAYGFGYLGFAVTIIACIIYIVSNLSDKANAPGLVLLILLSLCLYGLIICYALFVPAVFLSILIFVFATKNPTPALAELHMLKSKHSKAQSTASVNYGFASRVINCAVVFAIPVIAALLQFWELFLSSGETGGTGMSLGSAISAEGGVYRSLFANFVFLAPACIYWIAKRFKSRDARNSYLLIAIFTLTGVTALMFVGGSFGLISSYYYYKTYYALWLLYCVAFAFGLNQLSMKDLTAAISYVAVWLVVAALAITGVDSKLSDSNPRFNPGPDSWNYFPVQYENYQHLRSAAYEQETLDLFKQAYDLEEDTDEEVPAIGYYIDMYWYDAIVGSVELGGDYPYWKMTDIEFVGGLESAKYLTCIYDELPPDVATSDNSNYKTILDDFLQGAVYEILYENEAGQILQFK